MKYKVYLDNCCYNRPYDYQSQETIKIEAEAKIFIQDNIKRQKIDLIWSFILSFENAENPYTDQREAIAEWENFSTININSNNCDMKTAKRLFNKGIKPKDSLHIACAVAGKADYFITTDKQLLKKENFIKKIKIINPVFFISVLEENHDE